MKDEGDDKRLGEGRWWDDEGLMEAGLTQVTKLSCKGVIITVTGGAIWQKLTGKPKNIYGG